MTGFKYGRLPALIPAGLRDLTWYSAAALPKPPTSVAVPKVGEWGMLGNDTYGDCGPAGLEHGMMADAAITSKAETFPDADRTVEYYLGYTGGQDTGVVLSGYLGYVRRNKYYGHTVAAYAPVDVHNIPLLHTAISLYDFAYTGITVTVAMLEAFRNGGQWATPQLNSPVDGGHCIPLVGYDDGFLYAVTWGRVQAITYPMWHRIADEAWAVMTGELDQGDGRGVNYAALTADLNRLAA